MTQYEMNNAYFEWMYYLVSDDKQSYRKLLFLLHDIDFTYTLNMDGNRYDDGVDLRYRFADERGYPDRMAAKYLDNCPCSVLEMLIALSIRLEEHIMADPDIGNRTGTWFWAMLSNLELDDMDDDNFNPDRAKKVIRRFLNRDYSRDGAGGLFRIENCKYDLRDVDIWYQANWYLNSRK